MATTKKFNIPPRKQAQGTRIKLLDGIAVGTCLEMGEYSEDLMHSISSCISKYTKKSQNKKKGFAQRQERNGKGELIINLYRIK